MTNRDPQTYAIIGAGIEVHKQLGVGFLEGVYHEAFAIEMSAHKIPFQHEVDLPIRYKGHQLSTYYRADFICFENKIVELNALKRLSGTEESQIINYLGKPRKCFNEKFAIIMWFAQGKRENYCFPNSKNFPVFT